MLRRILIAVGLLCLSSVSSLAQSAYCPMYALSAKTITTNTYTPNDGDECFWLVFTKPGVNTLTLPAYASNGQFLSGYNIGAMSIAGPLKITLLKNFAGATPKYNNSAAAIPNVPAGSNVWLRVGNDGNWYGFLSGTTTGNTGNVTGPISSIAGDLPYFFDTTGQFLGDTGIQYSSILTTNNSATVTGKTFNCANNSCQNWPLGSVTGTLSVSFGGTGLVGGNSGGILGFTSGTTLASSAVLTLGNPVVGQGAGATPVTATRTGISTNFVTYSGSVPVNGDCASWNGNGDLVDSGGVCGGGGGSGTVTAGTTPQLAYYATSSTTVSSAANTSIVAGLLSLGTNNSIIGQVKLFGNTSGSVILTPQAVSGTVTITLPTTTGTLADSVSLPLVLDAVAGNITCPTCATTTNGGALSATSPIAISAAGLVTCSTCATTTNGGAITGTAPVSVSAAGAISITGVAGQVLAGTPAAFTATPTLGVNASTTGALGLANGGASGVTVTVRNNAATSSYNFNLPATAGTSGQPLLSAGGGASPMTFGTLGVAAGGTGQTTSGAGTVLAGTGAATSAYSATPTLGVAGTTLGTLALTGNTSGTITVKPQPAAGTYNFNLPITAGLVNQPLVSGGGGSTAMSWGTIVGNTAAFVTYAGNAPVSGHCAQWDVNGNASDSGSACGSGGGGAVSSVSAGNAGILVTPTTGAVVVTPNFLVQVSQHTTSYTLVSATDAFTTLRMNCAVACSLTINTSTPSYMPPGSAVNVVSVGVGVVTVQIGAGTGSFFGVPGTGGLVTSFTLNQVTNTAYIQSDNNGSPNNYMVNVSGGSVPACVITATGVCATPTKIVQVACNANINSAISGGGGGADVFHVVIYQLTGTIVTPCTYVSQQYHTASNIVIQGQADPLANPIGASTILDGGDGSATGGVHLMTCGLPSTASPYGFCPGATGDGTSNVTLQYVTIQNYGGSKTCPTTGSTNGCQNVSPNECGWQNGGAFAGDTAENWCPQFIGWNNWLVNHSNLTLSGGYAAELVGGGGSVQNSLINHNQHGGILVETTYAFGNNGGPFTLTNNEATDNNKRGDDPLNDANGLTKSVSRADFGGPENAVNVINNYVHDNNAVGIWSDIDSSHAILYTGNTVINSLAPPTGLYVGFSSDCIRVEINSGYSELSHNVLIDCTGYTISLTNSSNTNIHNNYSYVDNVDYTSAGGIAEVITCRADNPSGIIPGVAVNVDNNITVFAANYNANGSGGLTGYFDYTGTSNTPQGAGCAQPFPSVAQYATNNFGNRFGNLYYSPGGAPDKHWGFAAQGNAGNKLSWVQGDGNPQHGPVSGTVTGWATNDCLFHVSSISAGNLIYPATAIWSATQTTPLTITGYNVGGGGIGSQFDNWCPAYASSGAPITLNTVFGGNQELGSSVRPGAVLPTSTVNGSGLLTLGAAPSSGTIAVGQLVAANDGTNKLPFGTYVKSLVSGGGQTNGSQWQLSSNPTPGAITSTTINFNATKSYITGCTNGIATGGCPNGSGI